MMFWIIAIALSVLVAGLMAAAVLRVRRTGPVRNAGAADMALYRDQLAEVDRDLARGTLTEAEAEAVRLEISRRLLDADRRAQAEATPARSGDGGGMVAIVIIVLVAIGGTAALYAGLGAPGYGDLPLERRIALAEEARASRPSQAVAENEVGQPATGLGDPQVEELLQRLREAVSERPSDLQGALLLARNEARQGRFIAARQAQETVIRLKGDSATLEDWAQLTDMLVLAAGGYVSPEAEAAIGEVIARDPRNGTAQYYLGLMFAQTGRPDRAFTLWRRLLEDSPADAPWIAPIRAQIEDLARVAGVRYELPDLPAGLPGPSAADIAAAQDMDSGDRDAMIRGMVDGLSDRLATEGGPASEWARLITALSVLDERDRAAAIAQEAMSVFAADPQSVAQIEDAIARAGL